MIQATETTVQRPTEIKFFQHARCELVEQFARRRDLGTVFKHIQESAWQDLEAHKVNTEYEYVWCEMTTCTKITVKNSQRSTLA